jgi:hypothetical protein
MEVPEEMPLLKMVLEIGRDPNHLKSIWACLEL